MNDKQVKVLEELKKGKNIKEAANVASTFEIIVKRWIECGKKGDKEYAEFYKEYIKINQLKSSDNKFDDEKNVIFKSKYNSEDLETELFINNRLKELSLKELDFILGDNHSFQFLPDKQRKIFTIKSDILLEDICKSLEKLKELKNTEDKIIKHLNEFDTVKLLKYLSNRDQVLYINQTKKNIINKIIKDLNFVDYKKFYDALFDNNSVEILKNEKIKDQTVKNSLEISELTNNKKCVICGKSIPSTTKKDKCKSCLNSIHAANTLHELLNFVDPQISFFKEDLKELGYSKLKIYDTIWVLKENNLLLEISDEEYLLVKKELIDNFFNDWGNYVEEKDETLPNHKLSKECIICNNAFTISQFSKSSTSADGYYDYCKECEKPIKAARSLKELLQYVGPEEVFKKREIYHNYSEQFLLDSTIFLLQEQDLIDSNRDGERFRLKEKSIIDEFLDKYYIKEDEIPITKIPKKLIAIDSDPIETNTSNQSYKVKYESGIDSDPIETNTEYNDELIRKMKIVLYYLKEGFTEKEAASFVDLNKDALITWRNSGEEGEEPYDYFYLEYNNLKKEGIIEEETEFKYTKKRHQIVIDAIRGGETRKDAAKLAGVTIKNLDKWYSLGKYEKIEPYKSYYEEYNNIMHGNKTNSETCSKNTELILNEEELKIKEKMELFADEIIKTKSVKKAFKNSDFSPEEFDNWVYLANNGEKLYENFLNIYSNSLKFIINEKIRNLRINEAYKLIVRGYDINKVVNIVNNIDYTNKEKEFEEKLTKEREDLIKDDVIGIDKESSDSDENCINLNITSQNQVTGLLTLLITGKIKKGNLLDVFDNLIKYENQINKILTKQYGKCHKILIELEINYDELFFIRSSLIKNFKINEHNFNLIQYNKK